MRKGKASPTLLITRDFDPYCPRPGSMIRAVTLANFLARNGTETHVLAVRRMERHSLLDVDASVRVHWVTGWLDFFSGKPRKKALFPLYIVATAARFLLNRIKPAWYVDGTSTDIRRISAAAYDIARRYGIRNVIVSTPPHSLQQVGVALKSRLGPDIFFLADLRDGWSVRSMYRAPPGSASSRRQDAMERACFQAADRITTVTTGLRQAYEKKFQSTYDLEVVANGYDDGELPEPSAELASLVQDAHAQGKMVIGYFGSATIGYSKGHKDLGPLIRLFRKDPEIASRVILVVYGYIELQLMTLPSNVVLNGIVNGAQARANMALVDAGLMAYTDNEDAHIVMAGKIYDYVASAIPIWFLAPATATSILEFVERTEKPLFSDVNREVEIRSGLLQLLEEHRAGHLQHRGFEKAEAQEYSRANQYRKILDLLK